MHVYQYITIHRRDPVDGRHKTPRWSIINNSSGLLIGTIEWYGPWRQFIFHAQPNTVWSTGYLADVQDALALAKADYAASKAPKTATLF